MRGSACITAKLVRNAFPAMRVASSIPLAQALARFDQIVGQTECLAFLVGQHVAGEHHVHHAGDADQPRNANRAAAADKDAARTFGQRVIGLALGHADMRRSGKLKTSAHDSAVHHGDDGNLPKLDLIEDAMPQAGVPDRLFDVVRTQIGQVEAGRKVVAIAVQHHRLHALGQMIEKRLDPEHRLIVERVALLGPVEPEDGDVPARLGVERGGQGGGRRR